MKAVILARVSTHDQEEGHSLNAQSSRLTEYAIRKGLTVIKVFTIIESSTLGDRRKFNECLKFCQSQKETIALISDAVDRMQRSFKDSVLLDDLVRREKIELHFYRENMVIGKNATATDIMRWDFAVMSAKSYVLQLSENVKRSVEHKLKNGEFIRPAPLGYSNYRDEHNKSQIMIDPVRGKLVKRLFEEYSKGGASLREICQLAEDIGLKTKKERRLSVNTLHQILQNPFYYGVMKVNNKLYPHKYEPLISLDLYEKCQAVRLGYSNKPVKYSDKPFIYRGLIKCVNSGKTITTQRKKDKYNYLTCWKKDGKPMMLREEEIDAQVKTILDTIKISEDLITKINADLKAQIESEKRFYMETITNLRRDIDKANERISRVLNLYIDGKITEENYNQKLNEFTEDKIKH